MLQVKVGYPLYDEIARLSIHTEREGPVVVLKLAHGGNELLLVPVSPGTYGDRNHGLGKLGLRKNNLGLWIGKRIAGPNIFDLRHGDDVARLGLFDWL